MKNEKIVHELSIDDSSACFTVDQAAQYLKLSKTALYVKNSRREIPFIKMGSRIRYLKSDLDSWLLQKRIPAMNMVEVFKT